MSIDLVSDSYFLEHLPIPTAIIDLSNGAIIKHNGALMDLLSLSVGAIKKGRYAARDIFGSVAWEILGQHLKQKAYLRNYEIPVYNSAGEQLCCIVSFNVPEDEPPDGLDQIAANRVAVCVFQDISQQHKLNDHLYHNLIGDLKRYRQVVKTKELLQQTLDTIAEAQDFGDMLQRAIIKICETTGWDFVEVWHAPHDQQKLECHPAWYMGHHHDLPELYLKKFREESKNFTFPPLVGVPGKVWAMGEVIWIKDVSIEPFFIRYKLAQKYGLKSALGVPIKGENSVLAVMVFFSFMTLIEDQELISLVMTVGEQLGIAIERKQTELELQASQQKLSTLVNTIPGTFFSATYSNRLTIDYISEGCKALTGYGREEFLSQQIDFVDLVHFHDLAVTEKSRQQQLSKSSTYLLEYRIFTQCGEEKWIWEKGQGVCDEHGQVIGVEGLMMDITDRRRTEEALKQAEANYRGIVENALEGIFQTTFDGSYLSANPALAKIYGYSSPDELIRTLKNIETELYVKPGRRAEFIETLQEQEVVCDFQSQVYRKDRSIIWISENARAVKDQAGNLLYYEGTVEDITERHKLKEQLHLRAFYDNLTGLANRALFMDKLQESLEQVAARQNQELSPDDNYQFGLLFLDLDGFKKINDLLGHLMGDKLLIAIGERLLHCIRDRDIAARLGGDEFTILLTKISAEEQIIQVAERIQVALRTPFRFGNETVETGTSIGIFIGNVTNLKQTQKYLSLNPSNHQPKDNNFPTPEDILHRADIALYQAKMAGKGTYHIFQEQDC